MVDSLVSWLFDPTDTRDEMVAIRRFQEIEAWQTAHELSREINKITGRDEVQRDFAFCDQINRASVAAMSNIAEGFGRRTDKDFALFLEIARGSAAEVHSLLYVALDRRYVSVDEFRRLEGLANKLQAQLSAFVKYLRVA